jgi:hypothetical protein
MKVIGGKTEARLYPVRQDKALGTGDRLGWR